MNTASSLQEPSASELRQLREALLDAADAAADQNKGFDRIEIIERLLGPALCHRLGIFRIPADFKLSVVMPVYNEVPTLAKVIQRVRATRLPLEIVIVDDGSRDGSREYLKDLQDSADEQNTDLKIVLHEKNQGKGGAIKSGFLAATGDVVVIQDADLEYDPQEYPDLLKPLLEGKADAVYGSRFMIVAARRVMYFWHSVANWIVSGMCNLVADLNLTEADAIGLPDGAGLDVTHPHR